MGFVPEPAEHYYDRVSPPSLALAHAGLMSVPLIGSFANKSLETRKR